MRKYLLSQWKYFVPFLLGLIMLCQGFFPLEFLSGIELGGTSNKGGLIRLLIESRGFRMIVGVGMSFFCGLCLLSDWRHR